MKTHSLLQVPSAPSLELHHHREHDHIDQPYDIPDSSTPTEDPEDPSDLDDFHTTPDGDTHWEVFLPDGDEYDRDPDPRDFEGMEPRTFSEDFD